MKILRTVLLGSLLLAPMTASAEEAAPPAKTVEVKDARLIPAMRDGVFTGMKVYAIRAGGRFDQPHGPFSNGDTIVQVDGKPMADTEAGIALRDRVILGKADVVVVVERKGQRVTLTSKAIR